MFHVPNKYRIRSGEMGSDDSYGNNGAFMIPLTSKDQLAVIASDRMGWEHVSVSLRNDVPRWRHMCFIKEMFWDAEDCVIQYHPPKSVYINVHPNCLHLWRPVGMVIPLPPTWMIGGKLIETIKG